MNPKAAPSLRSPRSGAVSHASSRSKAGRRVREKGRERESKKDMESVLASSLFLLFFFLQSSSPLLASRGPTEPFSSS